MPDKNKGQWDQKEKKPENRTRKRDGRREEQVQSGQKEPKGSKKTK